MDQVWWFGHLATLPKRSKQHRRIYRRRLYLRVNPTLDQYLRIQSVLPLVLQCPILLLSFVPTIPDTDVVTNDLRLRRRNLTVEGQDLDLGHARDLYCQVIHLSLHQLHCTFLRQCLVKVQKHMYVAIYIYQKHTHEYSNSKDRGV